MTATASVPRQYIVASSPVSPTPVYVNDTVVEQYILPTVYLDGNPPQVPTTDFLFGSKVILQT